VFSAFDIERKNVYSARGGHTFAVAGTVESKGVELAGAVRPIDGWKLWGNIAYVHARYINFIDPGPAGLNFSGNTPPNVPTWVANAGTSYRFATYWPVEVGATVRYVGNRFLTDNNEVTMLAYTIADAFAFVDVPRADNPIKGVDSTRIGFRVRNLLDRAAQADLPLERLPVKDRAGCRTVGQLLPLLTGLVGVENESSLVEGFEEHDPH